MINILSVRRGQQQEGEFGSGGDVAGSTSDDVHDDHAGGARYPGVGVGRVE